MSRAGEAPRALRLHAPLALGLALVASNPAAAGDLPPGFVKTRLIDGLDSPTSIAPVSPYRQFVTELGGRVLVVDQGVVLPNPLVQLPADRSTLDRGLFRIRLDPGYATNGRVYFFWTTREPRNRVSRFTVQGDQADPASELVVWESPDLSSNYHHGGSLAFSPEAHLYVGVGDQYKSANAQDLSNPYGKVLRLWPDGTIPIDNPYVNDNTADPAIWLHGVRNPFRLTVDETKGTLWVGDVGGNTDDAWEEIDEGLPGLDYGWPAQEGEACYTSDCSAYEFPVFSFTHPDPEYWYGTEQGSMTLGPVYAAEQYPEEFHGNLFFGDYSNQWIRRLVFDEHLRHGPSVEVFEKPPGAGSIVDLQLGPEGSLYSVTIGWEIDGTPLEAGVWRYDYTGTTNEPPIAVAAAQPREGDAPLGVRFTGSGSSDPDGGPEPLEYLWEFGDGDTSTEVDLDHVYDRRGSYFATLTVDDGEAFVQSSALEITVGGAPRPRILDPDRRTRYRAGDTILFQGRARDAEDGLLPDSAFTWEVRLIHKEHSHSYFGPISGVSAGQFSVDDSGHSPEDTHLELRLGVVDSDGIRRTVTRALLPVAAPLHLDSRPSGVPLNLDGEYLWTPRPYLSVANFQHVLAAQEEYELAGVRYRFVEWNDGSRDRTRVFRAPDPGSGPGPGLHLQARYLPVLK